MTMKVQILCSEQSLQWAEHHSCVKAIKKIVWSFPLCFATSICAHVLPTFTKESPLIQHVLYINRKSINPKSTQSLRSPHMEVKWTANAKCCYDFTQTNLRKMFIFCGFLTFWFIWYSLNDPSLILISYRRYLLMLSVIHFYTPTISFPVYCLY